MRKIDQAVRDAFWNRKKLVKSNTVCTGNKVFLHGNLIVERRGDEVWATLAGWDTQVTARRLNGVLSGVAHVHRSNGMILVNRGGGTIIVDPHSWFRVC